MRKSQHGRVLNLILRLNNHLVILHAIMDFYNLFNRTFTISLYEARRLRVRIKLQKFMIITRDIFRRDTIYVFSLFLYFIAYSIRSMLLE